MPNTNIALNATLSAKISHNSKNSSPKKTHPTLSATVTLLATLTQCKKRHSLKQGIHGVSGVLRRPQTAPFTTELGVLCPYSPTSGKGFPGFPHPNKLGGVDIGVGFREQLVCASVFFLKFSCCKVNHEKLFSKTNYWEKMQKRKRNLKNYAFYFQDQIIFIQKIFVFKNNL